MKELLIAEEIEPALLTIEQAAAYCNLSVDTAKLHISRLDWEIIRVGEGRMIRVVKSSIDDWIARLTSAHVRRENGKEKVRG